MRPSFWACAMCQVGYIVVAASRGDSISLLGHAEQPPPSGIHIL